MLNRFGKTNIYDVPSGGDNINKVRAQMGITVEALSYNGAKSLIKRSLRKDENNKYFPEKLEGISEMESYSRIDILTHRKMMLYMLLLFEKYSDTINCFLQFRNSFEKLFFKNNIPKCSEILDKMKKVFGFTFWEIENRFLINSSTLELEEQYEYYHSIYDDKDVYSWILERLYSKCHYETYSMLTNTLKRSIKKDRVLKDKNSDLISCLILPPFEDHDRDSLNILRSITNFPLVDQYMLWKAATSEMLYKDQSKEETLNTYKKVCTFIDDKELMRAVNYSENKFKVNENGKKLLSLYTEGKYDEVIKYFEYITRNKHIYIEYYELIAKCYVFLNKKINDPKTIGDEILHSMIRILAVEEDCTNVYESLNKKLGVHYRHQWVSSIKAQINNIYNSSIEENNQMYIKHGMYSGMRLTPKYFVLAQNEQKHTFHDFTKQVIDVAQDNIPESRKIKYDFMRKVINKEKVNINFIGSIFAKKEKFLPYELEIITVDTYLSNNEIMRALNLICSCCICNEESYRCFPLLRVLKQTSNTRLNSIFIPILHSIYYKKISQSLAFEFKISVEEYLYNTYKTCKPSTVLNNPEKYDRYTLFFLEHVCVPEVLDSFPAYKSTVEVINERISILQLLQQYYSTNVNKKVEREYNDLLELLVVENGLSNYNFGKIYVDYTSIFNKFDKSYETRYLQIKHFDELSSRVKRMLKNAAKFNSDEAYLSLISEIVFQLAKDPSYGLDMCLSTEIRHGTFSNLMKSAAHEQHLLLDELKLSYSRDNYWCDYYLKLGKSDRDLIYYALADFTKKYSQLIEDAKTIMAVSLIPNEDVPAFNFGIDEDVLHLFVSQIPDMDYSKFIKECKRFFIDRLRIGIDTTRNFLNTELKNSLNSILLDLLTDISDVRNSNLPSLQDSISKAKDNIHSAIQTATEWFAFSEDLQISACNINDIIKIAEQAFTTINDKRKIHFCLNLQDMSIFVDACDCKHVITSLITAFDNAYQYSVKEQSNKIWVESKSIGKSNFQINIFNMYDQPLSMLAKRRFFRKLNSGIDSLINGELIHQEGRSGLYKINHLLNSTSLSYKICVQERDSKYFELQIRGGVL